MSCGQHTSCGVHPVYSILHTVGNNVYPVDMSCGEHGGLGYPVEHIFCGERRPQDKPTGYTEHYILWVYPVRVSEFYR